MATKPGQDYALFVRSFRADDLPRLLGPSTPPCISIYVPTHRVHPAWKQDPVRFKTAVSEAQSLLASAFQVRDPERFVEPLRALESEGHWEHSLDGLAVFLSPSYRGAYRLPTPVPERVVVAETFHVKPLLGFLSSNRRYFVLTLSQNSVSLYEGSSYGAGAVDLRSLPAGLRAALGVPDFDRAFSAHGSPSASMFHGRGPGREDAKESLVRYFREVDKGLRDFLREERGPLLLAAVSYYHSLYREVNTYPHLLDEGLDGNFERANDADIHAKAWPLVNRAFEREVGVWVDRYRSLAGTGLASDDLDEIAAAAIGGRVRCILAAEGEDLPGRLDRVTGRIDRSEARAGSDEDLLDDICEESIKRGAEVYTIARTAMPTPSPIAAVYRF